MLELSGIGDRKILEPLGIPVQVDLPSVGTNVQEHMNISGTRWSESVSDMPNACTDRGTSEMRDDQNVITANMLTDEVYAEKMRHSL